MKRSKVMLTAIGVLAVVGGALAFKAKKFGIADYCYNTNTNAVCCPKKITDVTLNVGNNLRYTITNNVTLCTTNNLGCPLPTGGVPCTKLAANAPLQ